MLCCDSAGGWTIRRHRSTGLGLRRRSYPCIGARQQAFADEETAMQDRAAIEKRRLGRGGPEVSALGLGCMSLSGVYGRSDDAAGIDLVRRAIELGVDHFDSSDMYGWGRNEELLGRALDGCRDGILVATKFGQTRRPGGANGVDGRPEYVAAACEASLKRLGVEVIDLYYQHRVDPAVPVEETVGAMARLVEAGKVRFLGLCEARPERIRKAHMTHPIAAVESEFSLLYREEATETRELTRDLGIAFVAYAPLGRSLLAGVVPDLGNLDEGDTRGRHPRFVGENFAKNRALVEGIEAIAGDKGCTPAQLCLAWLLAQGPDVIPIPGTKSMARLDENLGALAVRLSAAEVERIGAAIPIGAAAGTRYPVGGMRGVYI
jgi:aryl-alcohol dehydrogenase-like predicted oxidoreductase